MLKQIRDRIFELVLKLILYGSTHRTLIIFTEFETARFDVIKFKLT